MKELASPEQASTQLTTLVTVTLTGVNELEWAVYPNITVSKGSTVGRESSALTF